MTFEFTGNWETEIIVDAFKEFQSRGGDYSSRDYQQIYNGKVKLYIADDLSDNPDPIPEQIAAIDYLFNNQEAIIRAILDRVKIEYPELLEIYGDEDFPVLNTDEDIKKAIGFGTLHLPLEHKEGIAYLGYECGCNWDEEHGLGILMHKNRIIDFGAADSAFSTWKASEDNGTYALKQKEWERDNLKREKKPKPQLYKPHPKYGKLKPTQEDANKMYENTLIERGYNQEFIDLVENGQIDINVNKGLNMSFIERASQFNNTEIVKYILTKKPKDTEGVMISAASYLNKEIIEAMLNYGVPIDAPNYYGDTPLLCLIQRIKEDQLDKDADMISWLIEKGANPLHKNRNNWNAFDYLANQPQVIKNKVEKIIKDYGIIN